MEGPRYLVIYIVYITAKIKRQNTTPMNQVLT